MNDAGSQLAAGAMEGNPTDEETLFRIAGGANGRAVTWCLRYPLSYRDLESMFFERGFEVDHSTVNRWVLAYAPQIEK